MFRSRERSQAMLHDYTEEYSSRTDFGDLIIHQRLVMVNWMVEVSIFIHLRTRLNGWLIGLA